MLDSSVWKRGGDLELDGRRFQVRCNARGNRYTMVDDFGAVVASADRVGRKRWTVEAAGQIYQFRRSSFWGHEEELLHGATGVGSIRKIGFWRGDVAVELPGLATALQLFVLGVVISIGGAEHEHLVGAAGSRVTPPQRPGSRPTSSARTRPTRWLDRRAITDRRNQVNCWLPRGPGR